VSAPLANLVVGFIACGQHAYDTGFNLVEVQSAYALAKQDSKRDHAKSRIALRVEQHLHD
jgi:hypothetical protein